MQLTLTADRQRLVMWALVFAGVIVTGRAILGYTFRAGEEHRAEERVRRVLAGMKEGGNLQAAICLWELGNVHLPGGAEAFNRAADGFDAWGRQKGIATVSDYEVLSAKLVKEGVGLAGAVVHVTARINGQTRTMRVVQGEEIAWMD